MIDGDTLVINGEHVRLFGIDAPEAHDSGGQGAKRALQGLVGRNDPKCERVETDRYRRTVALCAANGADLSLAMLRSGYAVTWCFYIRKNRPSLLQRFQSAEADAKRDRRGLWSTDFKPWRDWGC